MKDELAARLLAATMNWDEKALSQYGPRLQNLAMVKYDDYGQYRPGERFVESLARWLLQFEAPADRETAIRFVLDDLVFVSRAELEHSIELVYPDYVRPLGRRVVAADLGASPFSVTAIVTNPEFPIVSPSIDCVRVVRRSPPRQASASLERPLSRAVLPYPQDEQERRSSERVKAPNRAGKA